MKQLLEQSIWAFYKRNATELQKKITKSCLKPKMGCPRHLRKLTTLLLENWSLWMKRKFEPWEVYRLSSQESAWWKSLIYSNQTAKSNTGSLHRPFSKSIKSNKALASHPAKNPNQLLQVIEEGRLSQAFTNLLKFLDLTTVSNSVKNYQAPDY